MFSSPPPTSLCSYKREASFWSRTALTGLLGICASLAGGAEAQPAVPRNVVIIVIDDLNDSIAGFGGHPQARTPHLDHLRQRATTFHNAHCNAPICGPSRASMWTGLLPTTTGYYGYQQQRNHWRQFPAMAEAPTLMQRLRDAGFQVGGTGKVFHNGHEDNSVWSDKGAISGSGYASDFGPWPWDGSTIRWGRRHGVGHPRMPGEFAGFRWDGFGPLSDVPQVPANDDTPGYTGWVLGDGPYRWDGPEDRDPMPDERNAQWASERLLQHHDQRFLMVVGMNRPHAPRYAPDEYFELFPLDEVQLPAYRADDLDDVPSVLWQNEDGTRAWQAQWLPRLLEAGGEEWWRRSVRSYLACVAFVDAQVGVVLNALEQGPHSEDTLIIITSDHGFHLGEKDHLKKTTIWEEVTRVPLIIAGPGVSPGATVNHPVSLVDLYPTVLAALDLPPAASDHALDGHSLLPFLHDSQAHWEGPEVALSVLHGPYHIEPHQRAAPEKQHHSVRDRRYRYTLCSDGSEELYDLQEDPHCWVNQAGNPDYATHQQRLRQHLLDMVSGSTP